jgi:hypothetical protein
MRIRQFWLLLAMLAIPTVASADGHRAGAFGGLSFARGSTLTGFHINVEHTLTTGDDRHVYGTADYSVHDGDGFKRQTFMGGINAVGRWKAVSAGVRGLLGGVWGDGSGDISGSIGAQIELGAYSPSALSKPVRIESRTVVDQVFRGGPGENFWRVSTGIVVKFQR